MSILLPSQASELFDRISVLNVKKEMLPEEKSKEAARELSKIVQYRQKIEENLNVYQRQILQELYGKLYRCNLSIWISLEKVQSKRKTIDFKAEASAQLVEFTCFAKSAADVYDKNIERFKIKSEIDTLLGSEIKEVKGYASS